MPPRRPHVTEYQLHTLTCARCGAATPATLPAGVPRGAFGPQLAATVAVCTGVYHLSRRTTVGLMTDLFGVELALGSVSTCEQAVSAAVAAPVAEAHGYVQHSKRSSTFYLLDAVVDLDRVTVRISDADVPVASSHVSSHPPDPHPSVLKKPVGLYHLLQRANLPGDLIDCDIRRVLIGAEDGADGPVSESQGVVVRPVSRKDEPRVLYLCQRVLKLRNRERAKVKLIGEPESEKRCVELDSFVQVGAVKAKVPQPPDLERAPKKEPHRRYTWR